MNVVNWLNGCLKNVTHKLFKDVTEVTGAEINPMADGQIVIISDINRVTLVLKTPEGEKTLRAVAKFEPTTESGMDLAKDCEVFESETMMYGDILKSMENLMSVVGDKDLLWPECYHCGDKKLLLEDLCEVGYRVVPTHEFLDVEHTLLVMKALGKFHALSMAMKERAILDTTKLRPSYLSKKVPFMINVHKLAVSGLAQVIKELWGPEWSSVPERIIKLVENPGDAMADMVESSKGKWDVMVHGDFSMRNMLFHYPPNSNKPDCIKFVDFQMCNYNNLGLDLVSLLYSSVLPQVREDNMDKLLGAYADSVATTCRRYNYQGSVPSKEDVRACLKSLPYLTTTTSICSYPFFVATGKTDMQKVVDEDMKKYTASEEDVTVTKSSISEQDYAFYTDKAIEGILKYEIKRCMEENIF